MFQTTNQVHIGITIAGTLHFGRERYIYIYMYVSNCLLWFINYLSQPNHTQPQKHSNKHHHQTYRMFSKLLLKTCQGMEPDSCREAGWSCWEIFRHRAIRKNQAFRRPQNSNVTMALWLMVLKNNEKMWYNLRTINHSVTKTYEHREIYDCWKLK